MSEVPLYVNHARLEILNGTSLGMGMVRLQVRRKRASERESERERESQERERERGGRGGERDVRAEGYQHPRPFAGSCRIYSRTTEREISLIAAT